MVESLVHFFQGLQWVVECTPSGIHGVSRSQFFCPDIVFVGDEVEEGDSFMVARNIRHAPMVDRPLIILFAKDSFYKEEGRDEKKIKALFDACVVQPETQLSTDECREWQRFCETFAEKKEVVGFHNLLYPFSLKKEEEVSVFDEKSTPSIHEKNEIEMLKELVLAKEKEAMELKMQVEALSKRATLSEKEKEEFKERVRRDIQHIRVREKELETKLEIVKRDQDVLLSTKDKKILELTRKIDSMEYEMETLTEKERLAEAKILSWKEKMERLVRTLKIGTSLLEGTETEIDISADKSLPKKGSKAA